MKTSAVLASVLFSLAAVAAPVDKRALVYHTETVIETVVVYTTVYDDDVVPEATPTPSPEGLFYEQPASSSSSSSTPIVVPTPSPEPAPAPAPVVETPTSIYTPAPPPAPETPSPAPTSTYVAPAPVPEAPKPTTSEAAYVPPPPPPAPAPVPEPTTSAAPVYAAPPAPEKPAATGSTSSGEQFSNVDITIYDNNGSFGACGTELHDTDMIVALAQPAWGQSTYDVMTGASTNPWCGQKIQVEYEGNTIEATIMDLCPGCSGHDIDLSLSAWKALTGLDEKTRLKASWSKIS
ncbi:hypothetical protein J1614_001710 [Plenodomus biglobosus]|nr:hypothetical protein J1614_001710 [Plenodomus biglobosus]